MEQKRMESIQHKQAQVQAVIDLQYYLSEKAEITVAEQIVILCVGYPFLTERDG